MFEYKTELLKTGMKMGNNKVNDKDVIALDDLINTRAAEGWELVTYSFIAPDWMQSGGGALITFKKQKNG